MADAGTVTVLWGVTAGVSAYYQIAKRHDPYPVLMASALGYGATAVIGELFDWGLAAAFAAVLCVGVVLARLTTITQGLTSLVGSRKG